MKATLTASTTQKIKLSKEQKVLLSTSFPAFLDAASTGAARATFYNTKDEQTNAIEIVHEALFSVDRGIYVAALLLPGVMQYSVQRGILRLIENPWTDSAVITPEIEAKALVKLCKVIKPQQMLNIFMEAKSRRVNNARTRKLILRTILGSDNIELWSVKYRRKIRECLTHAWGSRMAGIVKSILAKPMISWNAKEMAIVRDNILKHVTIDLAGPVSSHEQVFRLVSFVLGNAPFVPEDPRVDGGLLRVFAEARDNFELLKKLPFEVAEGIRGRYHKNRSAEELLRSSGGENMSKNQKIQLQKTAKEAGAKVDMDPMAYDAPRLYIYANEMGMNKKIEDALMKKAKDSARSMPCRYGKVAIILDASESMRGGEGQVFRPMAIALATRDMLVASSDEASVRTIGGEKDGLMAKPQGDTSIARYLVQALKEEPEAVFVITDGYENVSAGRFDETVRVARKFGNTTPIYQISPVMAAESLGVRTLSNAVAALPLSSPQAMGLMMLKSMFEIDAERGVSNLIGTTMASLAKE